MFLFQIWKIKYVFQNLLWEDSKWAIISTHHSPYVKNYECVIPLNKILTGDLYLQTYLRVCNLQQFWKLILFKVREHGYFCIIRAHDDIIGMCIIIEIYFDIVKGLLFKAESFLFNFFLFLKFLRSYLNKKWV